MTYNEGKDTDSRDRRKKKLSFLYLILDFFLFFSFFSLVTELLILSTGKSIYTIENVLFVVVIVVISGTFYFL